MLSITVAARAWCVVSGSAAPVLGVEVGIEFMPYKNSLCSGCPMLSPLCSIAGVASELPFCQELTGKLLHRQLHINGFALG